MLGTQAEGGGRCTEKRVVHPSDQPVCAAISPSCFLLSCLAGKVGRVQDFLGLGRMVIDKHF